MASYCEVFERTEKKYRLDARQHRYDAGGAWRAAWSRTRSASRRITSLYFDTPDRAAHRAVARQAALQGEAAPAPLRRARADERRLRVRRDQEEVQGRGVQAPRGDVARRRRRAYLGGMPYERACARFPLTDPCAAAESTSAAQPADRARDRPVQGAPRHAAALHDHRVRPRGLRAARPVPTASCASRSTRTSPFATGSCGMPPRARCWRAG